MTRRILAVVLSLQVAACGWTVTPPPSPPPGLAARPIADRVVLRVDATALAWGGTGLGETVRDTLVQEGAFRDVYYPIEPRNPPALTLAITARGTVDEHEDSGFVKAVVIGLLLFLPVGLIRFDKTFNLDADVVLRDGDLQLERFQVTSATEIDHTMFSHMEEYEPVARKAAFTNLGRRIAAQLRATPSTP